ncbi:unnamed protein product [Rhizophagus irregularis]|nr:unnamed protein product [Rhizophagus irregularis]
MDSIVFIKIVDDSTSKMKKLDLDSSLSDIRKELEKNNIINDTFLFSEKRKNVFEEIERDYEDDMLLNEIIEKSDDSENKFLYLKKYSNPYWKFFIKECDLEYGCTMSFDGIKTANRRVFIVQDCEFNLLSAENYKKGQLKYKSKEDWMKERNLFFNTNINIQDFIVSGISLEDKNFEDEKFDYSTYQYAELAKASLKFRKENLRLTKDFKSDVNNAVKSSDPKEFRKIIEKYGRFVPTEVILGGRDYYKNVTISPKILVENSKGDSVGYNSKLHNSILSDSKAFNENTWIESLKDYQNWNCIEFKNPIGIFQLLPDDLYKETYKSIGKRILYTYVENYDYYIYKPGMCGTYTLINLPQNILNIILNKDSDCDIFARVIDADKDSKDVIFNCQILYSSSMRPSIIIHGIQKQFQVYKYELKVGIMIVGYDINFSHIASDIIVQSVKVVYDSQSQCMFDSISLEHNLDSTMKDYNPVLGTPILSSYDSSNKSLVIGHNFCKDKSGNLKINIYSYCVEKKCYVNIPKFTFNTFIITSNKCDSSTYTSSFPFKFDMYEKPIINFTDFNPKFVSLYLLDSDDHIPIFLNQNSEQISIEYISCKCNKTCIICKNKTKQLSENDDHLCIFFDIYLSKNNNYGPSELINSIIKNKSVRFIRKNELSEMSNIGVGHFGTISKARWKKTNDFVACKKLKNIQSIHYKQIKAFLHELNMHKKVDFCTRIIRILGISYDTNIQEYSLIMQYADGGDLRKYLQKKMMCIQDDIDNNNNNNDDILNITDSKSKQNDKSENNKSDTYCIETEPLNSNV